MTEAGPVLITSPFTSFCTFLLRFSFEPPEDDISQLHAGWMSEHLTYNAEIWWYQAVIRGLFIAAVNLCPSRSFCQRKNTRGHRVTQTLPWRSWA
ncbi:hypothetical protein Q5P01_016420 [Channa striata]|uniref:Uncharacterized protein n=1 Tax=Channa striata TaxID=64152 RepID=A0AA88MHT3_CHASR|nr:hypothetical protein Q5P01_016420 [Channa striata]